KPLMVSEIPTLAAGATDCLRNQAMRGRWVSICSTMATTAQKAERPAENCSTVRHQTRIPMGIRKYRPERTVGHDSGLTGLVMLISVGRSGCLALTRNSHKYRAIKMQTSMGVAASPATACTPTPIQYTNAMTIRL